MKKIKKEVEVIACEICGEAISNKVRPVEIIERGGKAVRENKDDKGMIHREYYNKEDEEYNFHKECVDELLIKTAKKLNN